MERRPTLAAALGICLTLGIGAFTSARADGPPVSGLAGTSATYGYNPYKVHYGPLYAQRELDFLTYRPGVRGLDYGYGIGYWFGFGPPKQYRLLPPTRQTQGIRPGH